MSRIWLSVDSRQERRRMQLRRQRLAWRWAIATALAVIVMEVILNARGMF